MRLLALPLLALVFTWGRWSATSGGLSFDEAQPCENKTGGTHQAPRFDWRIGEAITFSTEPRADSYSYTMLADPTLWTAGLDDVSAKLAERILAAGAVEERSRAAAPAPYHQ